MGLDTKTYWLTDRQSQCDFESESSFETPACQDMSLGIELSWQLQNNSKKRIRLWKEDLMCDFNLQ
jgi:hypothetical protein